MPDERGSQESTGEVSQLITFTVGGEEYGVEILRVREIIRSSEVAPLPQAPGFVKGVLNLRGEIIPVIDLREKFGLDPREDSPDTRIIVTDVAGKLVGMKVDAANQVVRVPSAQIDPAPAIVEGIADQYLRGVAHRENGLVVILEIERILSGQEKIDLDELIARVTEMEESKS